jgi:C1A family cysteine protease
MKARMIQMPFQIKHYGWTPDLPDQRDHLYAAPLAMLTNLPTTVDLRSKCPPIYDQGQLGSCTANAIAAAFEFDEMKEQLTPTTMPSRLFIYYNERAMEGTVNSDAGARIRDGIKSVAKQGSCPEELWPYDISQFAHVPSPACYQAALHHKAVSYQSIVPTLNQLKARLASGYPFVFGFTVYESFESQAVASSGQVPMPAPNEQVVGGHAVVAVGYDDSTRQFLVRNSWGVGWGMQGYCSMPYEYLTTANLASDFWAIQTVK